VLNIITIIDYNLGNLGSIQNLIKKAGYESIITNDKKDILAADKLILPGVGSFDKGMANLTNLELICPLTQKVLIDKTPILGVCLGMQLFCNNSSEGVSPGLKWINAEVIKFQSSNLKIPHMGWNTIIIKKESSILKNLDNNSRFYFVHSYYLHCFNPSDILTTTIYGPEFVSAVQNNNIYGCQFHPEKSHRYGLQLIKNFIELI